MNRISFAAKMGAIAALFVVPIAALLVILFAQMQQDVDFTAQERLGTAYTLALRPLFVDLEGARRASGAHDGARLAVMRTNIEADVAAAEKVDATTGKPLGLTAALQALRGKSVAASAPAAFDAALADLVALLGTASDNSKITLDPVLESYYVGDTMVNKLPSLIDGVARVDVLGRTLRQGRAMSADDRVTIAVLSGQIAAALDGIDHNVPIAIGAAPVLRGALQDATATTHAATSQFLTAVRTTIAKGGVYAGNADPVLDAAFAQYDTVIRSLDGLLRARVDGLHRRELVIFGFVFAMLALAAILMVVSTRSIARRLSAVSEAIRTIVDDDVAQFAELAKAVARGDLRVRSFARRAPLNASGSDEAAVLARSYNALTERLFELSGDFATMTRLLGSLIDGVGDAAASLAQTSVDIVAATTRSDAGIAEIAVAADGVARDAHTQAERAHDANLGVSEIARTATQIAQGAHEQATAVGEAAQGVDGLDLQIASVAKLGDTLAAAARRSAEESSTGARAVTMASESVVRLRDNAAALESVMASLEDRSNAVVQIVATIDGLAEQTNLLALNAAIEAARAGQHGRGFAVVADEVRKLAERSTESTKEIARILSSVRDETLQAATTMRVSTEAMNDALGVARDARAAFGELAAAIEQTSQIAIEVAAATQQMRATSAGVSANMQNVSAIVEQNASAAHELEATTQSVDRTIEPLAQSAKTQSAAAERVAASTEGLATQAQRTMKASQTLREAADRLLELVQGFRRNESAAALAMRA